MPPNPSLPSSASSPVAGHPRSFCIRRLDSHSSASLFLGPLTRTPHPDQNCVRVRWPVFEPAIRISGLADFIGPKKGGP